MRAISGPVHFSQLKSMGKSPLHYQHAVTSDRTDTVAFRRGRLVHSIVLNQPLPLVWDGARRGKAWEAFRVEARGEVVTQSELDDARPIAEAVRKHPEAMRLLDGEQEIDLEWEWLGRKCAGRIDTLGKDWITELKTCRDGRIDWFAREALRFDYHAQLAWYRNGVTQSRRVTPREAYIVAVESVVPYPVVVWHLTERALDQGERRARLWMERLLACERFNDWPGYVEGTIDLDVPDIEDGFSLRIDGEEMEVA